jgi:hypothetical protein
LQDFYDAMNAFNLNPEMEPRISRIDADGRALGALLALTHWGSSAERVWRSQILESASSA